MALTRNTLVMVILCFILIQAFEGGNQHKVEGKHINCRSRCNYRCSKADRYKVCMRACNSCCQRCNCVPPGTSGNRNVCPCYASLTTHGGKLKCP